MGEVVGGYRGLGTRSTRGSQAMIVSLSSLCVDHLGGFVPVSRAPPAVFVDHGAGCGRRGCRRRLAARRAPTAVLRPGRRRDRRWGAGRLRPKA